MGLHWHTEVELSDAQRLTQLPIEDQERFDSQRLVETAAALQTTLTNSDTVVWSGLWNTHCSNQSDWSLNMNNGFYFWNPNLDFPAYTQNCLWIAALYTHRHTNTLYFLLFYEMSLFTIRKFKGSLWYSKERSLFYESAYSFLPWLVTLWKHCFVKVSFHKETLWTLWLSFSHLHHPIPGISRSEDSGIISCKVSTGLKRIC